MEIYLLILLFGVGGLQAATDNRNQTVTCSFIKMNACLNKISALGGNLTSRYAVDAREMNETCKVKEDVKDCMKLVPVDCNTQSLVEAIKKVLSIGKFIDNLCNSTTDEYKKFLNSSVCYNKQLDTRSGCVKQNTLNGTDAKAFCCTSKKVQECMKNNITETVCPASSTSFQNHLIHTYSIYTDSLCGPYFKLCNGAVSNVLSLACMLLIAKIVLLNL